MKKSINIVQIVLKKHLIFQIILKKLFTIICKKNINIIYLKYNIYII